MSEIRENNMLHPPQLVADGQVDRVVAVPQQISPPGTDDIQILFAVDVIEPYPFGMINDNRRQLLIIFHLRAGMPDVFQIRLLRGQVTAKFKILHILFFPYSYNEASTPASISNSAAFSCITARTGTPVISVTMRRLSSSMRSPGWK